MMEGEEVVHVQAMYRDDDDSNNTMDKEIGWWIG